MARGRLRVYLGAAPGVGKTFAMLNEGWRGKHRGKDVVVGYVETHGRANNEAQIRDLEVVPRRKISYRGKDFVERITGVKQHETIPDAVVRAAEQVELVDMTPESLRRRMAHGNIYPPERIDASLANSFRPGNLAALWELALLWVADKVDESLQD